MGKQSEVKHGVRLDHRCKQTQIIGPSQDLCFVVCIIFTLRKMRTLFKKAIPRKPYKKMCFFFLIWTLQDCLNVKIGKKHIFVYFSSAIFSTMNYRQIQQTYLSLCFCSVASSCLTLCNLLDCSPLGSSFHGISRRKFWSGLPFPSPGFIFPTQGSNLSLLHWQADSLPLSHLGSPNLSYKVCKWQQVPNFNNNVSQ